MNSETAQKAIALIIYSVAQSPPKYIWFKILRLAGLEYHFSSQLVQCESGSFNSIQACRAGNFKLLVKYYDNNLVDIYCKMAYKYNREKIQKLYGDEYFSIKVAAICRYAPLKIDDFILDHMTKDGLIALGKNCNQEIIMWLLGGTADAQSKHKYLLRGACCKGNLELVKFLFSNANSYGTVFFEKIKKDAQKYMVNCLTGGDAKIKKNKKICKTYDYIMEVR